MNTDKVRNPTKVEDIFKGIPSKYKELLYFTSECMNTTDVAKLVITLEEQVLQVMIVIPVNNTYERVFVPLESGIWEEQFNRNIMHREIDNVRLRIKRFVLEPLERLIIALEKRGNKQNDLEKSKSLTTIIKNLLFKLGQETFKSNVIKQIIRYAAIRSKDEQVTLDSFDSKRNCVGFIDGVYDFNEKRLYRGSQAYKYYVTKTVGYSYEDVMNVSNNCMEETISFLKKIHPQDEIRKFVLKKLCTAIQGVPQQNFMVHYNITGKNGKTTFFKLVKAVYGEYFMKCNVALLYPQTFNNANQANEELISLIGINCALFSEPDSKQRISASFIKELTGGDEQSARANYGKKQTFTFRGLAHLLCNKIPELDDYDGGIARRLICIPYKSTFVDHPNQIDESSYKFLVDYEIDKKFDELKLAFMKLIIEINDETISIPVDVSQHTGIYLDRENTMKKFIEDTVLETSTYTDFIKLADLYRKYKDYCKDNSYPVSKRSMFECDLHLHLKEDNYRAVYNGNRNIWRQYQIKSTFVDNSDDELSL